MEVQLLHPQKKSRKWRPSLKKLFQRKKKLPEGDLKYFAAVDKFDPSEQDQTSTVNLSTASESNGGTSSSRLHSGDEHSSDDSASMGPQSRGGHRHLELRRRSSTPPVPMTHKLGTGAPVVVAEEHYTYSQSLTEDFAQLDVPSMEVHRTSSLWRKSKKPFVYKRNARSLDIPRNKNCDRECFDKESPIFLDADEEEGTEVVLFETASGSDNENDNGHETSSQSFEEGIFLSLQAPLHRSTTSKSQSEQQQQTQQQQELLNRTVSLSADSDMVALRRLQPSPSAALYTTDDVSPTLSKDVTWVSHDEDFSSEDDRPVKEIVFPTLTGHSLEPPEEEEEEMLGGARGGLLDPEYAAIEVDVAMSRSREEVRDAIFASLEEEEEEIIFDHRRFDDDFDSLSLEDFDPPQGDTKTSPKPTEDTKTKLWDSGVVVDTIALLAPSAEEPLERPLSSSPRRKAHSTAFLKRKSAFSGQDLLSEEAECFADFLEESGDDLSAIQADPHDIFSSEDRFLSAINASMMDDDGFPSLLTSEDGADAPATAERSTSVQKETYTSLDRSLGGGSSDMYTKSLSYDTSSISHSQGASFPSYSSSKGPSINGPEDVYCGARIFPREEDDDDDVYDDDFTEDSFSSHPSDNIHKQRRGGRKNRHPTTTLEDIRLDVLEAVQDMARSASSNMFKFLQD